MEFLTWENVERVGVPSVALLLLLVLLLAIVRLIQSIVNNSSSIDKEELEERADLRSMLKKQMEYNSAVTELAKMFERSLSDQIDSRRELQSMVKTVLGIMRSNANKTDNLGGFVKILEESSSIFQIQMTKTINNVESALLETLKILQEIKAVIIPINQIEIVLDSEKKENEE